MLKFCRTKFVGYEKNEDNTILKIFGTLDDTIYSMKVDLIVKLPELEITSISGEMRRVTTPFCNEAKDFLENAIGLKVESGFQSKIKRLIARPGCRHFGNLINECCESIVPGLISIKWKELRSSNPNVTIDEVTDELIKEFPQIESFCIGISKN
ncbi:MAG: DUF2889 domain-containing protein [Candidatus Helarchaeota archaeon]